MDYAYLEDGLIRVGLPRSQAEEPARDGAATSSSLK
jgi:hypothetical protein